MTEREIIVVDEVKLTETEIKVLLSVAWWKADGLRGTLIGPGNVGDMIWGKNPHRRAAVKSSAYARTAGRILNGLRKKDLVEYRVEKLCGLGRTLESWGWSLTGPGRRMVEKLKAEGKDLNTMVDEWNRTKAKPKRFRFRRRP